MSTTPTPYLFGRRYSLRIQTTGGDTITVSSDELGLNPLKFTFECETAAMKDAWFATFKIYNLNFATINSVINQGSTITLSAGYLAGQNYGMVWTGKVLWCELTKEHVTDHVITIQSIVGSDLRNNVVSFATGPYQTQRQLLTAMAAKMNTTINDPGNMIDDTARLPCPVVFFGQPVHYLRQACKEANTWGFPTFAGDVTILSLTPGGTSTLSQLEAEREIVSAGPDITYSAPIAAGSSLTADPNITYSIVGTPKQQLIGEARWGISFKVLLDARLQVKSPPMIVKIDGAAVIDQAQVNFNAPPPVLPSTGLYAVIAVGNYGDSRGNEWYTEVVAVGVSGTLDLLGFPSNSATGTDNRYVNANQSNQ